MQAVSFPAKTDLYSWPGSETRERPLLLYIVLLPFFLSGAAGLIAQITWTRSLSTILGGTAAALNVVLATFMMGLALGSWISRPINNRTQHPILWYVLLEASLSIYIYFSQSILSLVTDCFVLLLHGSEMETLAEQVFRACASGMVVLVPATLMGITTPLLITATTQNRGKVLANSGWLYGINTLGGVVGVLAAGCYLILKVGIIRTLHVAALLDAISAVLCLGLAWKFHFLNTIKPPKQAFDVFSFFSKFSILAFVAGFFAMSLEVIFARILVFSVAGSYFSHTIILGGFLTGIVTGSLIVSLLARRMRPDLYSVAGLFYLFGFATMIASMLFGLVSSALQHYLVEKNLLTLSPYTIKFLAVFGVTVFPAACSGMLLPVLLQVKADSGASIASASSRIFVSNTLGAVVGVLLTGFVLIGTVGLRNSVFLMSGGMFFTGTALLLGSIGSGKKQRLLFLLGLFGIAECILLVVMIGRLPLVVHSVNYASLGRPRILFYREEPTTSVSVLDLQRFGRSLFTNGLEEARVAQADGLGDTGWLGDVSVLAHPNTRTMLVAGLGSGKTAGVAGLYPYLEVTALEISKGVILALPYFDRFTYRASRNPRIKILEGDARHFLLATSNQYDVINTDVFISGLTGTSYLYNREFFELCRARLNPGGRTVIQIDLHNRIDRVVAKGFLSVFPEAIMWRFPAMNLSFLIGSNEALHLPEELPGSFLSDARIRNRLRLLGLLGAQQNRPVLIDRNFLMKELKNEPISTDDHPIVDFVGFDISRSQAFTW